MSHNTVSPFIRFLIPFISGIIIREFLPGDITVVIITCTAVILLSTFYIKRDPVSRFKCRNLFGLATSLLILSSGYAIHAINTPQEAAFSTDRSVLVINTSKEFSESGSRRSYYGKVVLQADTLSSVRFDYIPVVVYLDCNGNDSLADRKIYVTGKVSGIKKKDTYYSFDYYRFMRHKGIRYAVYADSVLHCEKAEYRYALLSASNDIKGSLLNKLYKNTGIRESDSDFLAAIMLGCRNEADIEMRERFASLGLSHILALSGLHTGVIFMLVMALLFPLRIAGLNRLRYFAAIVILWLYCFVTGCPASVTRAVCMISILLIGRMINRKSDIFNTVSASAMLMLVYDTNLLFDAGFQMSYAAVFSIIIFAPFAKSVYSHKSRPVVYLLDLINITISVQIISLPVSIIYFHYLPVWFLPGNLLVIPLITPLIFISAVRLALLYIGIDWSFADTIIMIINDYITMVTSEAARLPVPEFARNAVISVTDMVFFIALIYMTIRLIQKNRAVFMCAIAGLMTIWIVAGTFDNNAKRQEMLIYPDRALNFIFIDTERLYTFNEDSLRYIERIKENIVRENGISEVYDIKKDTAIGNSIIIKRPFIKLKERQFIIFSEKEMRYRKSPEPFVADYALIGGAYRGSLTDIMKVASPSQIILHNTAPRYLRDKIKTECDSAGIPYHDIYERGAFRIDFKNQ